MHPEQPASRARRPDGVRGDAGAPREDHEVQRGRERPRALRLLPLAAAGQVRERDRPDAQRDHRHLRAGLCARARARCFRAGPCFIHVPGLASCISTHIHVALLLTGRLPTTLWTLPSDLQDTCAFEHARGCPTRGRGRDRGRAPGSPEPVQVRDPKGHSNASALPGRAGGWHRGEAAPNALQCRPIQPDARHARCGRRGGAHLQRQRGARGAERRYGAGRPLEEARGDRRRRAACQDAPAAR